MSTFTPSHGLLATLRAKWSTQPEPLSPSDELLAKCRARWGVAQFHHNPNPESPSSNAPTSPPANHVSSAPLPPPKQASLLAEPATPPQVSQATPTTLPVACPPVDRQQLQEVDVSFQIFLNPSKICRCRYILQTTTVEGIPVARTCDEPITTPKRSYCDPHYKLCHAPSTPKLNISPSLYSSRPAPAQETHFGPMRKSKAPPKHRTISAFALRAYNAGGGEDGLLDMY